MIKALSSNASTNSLPSMDSDFGAAQPHILNQRIDDLMREGNGEFTGGTNGTYSESGIGSNADSACASRKTSAVSEGVVMDQGSDSQVESPSDSPVSVQNEVQVEREVEVVPRQESLPDSPKATPEAAQQRTRKLSRFLISPVILPDNTVAEKLPDPPKPEPVVPPVVQEPVPQTVQQIQQAVSMQQQAVETQQQLIQNVAPPIQNQYVNEQVIQTVQYQPIPSQPVPVAIETGEAQQVMVYDPKWQQAEQHALINQQLQQAMGLTPSQPVSATQISQNVPATPHPTVLQDPQLLDYQQQQLMPEPQLAQLQQFQATQQLLMDNNAPLSRDALDSLPAMAASMKLPETLEQLQKELENITHAHVSTKKESAPTTQNTSCAEPNPITGAIIEGQVMSSDGTTTDVDGASRQPQDGSALSQAEILQQQIQSYDNTSSISEVTTVNTSSGGPLSRDDTSVCNSRRTSADMNIEYGQTQAQIMYVEGTQGPVMVTVPIHHQPAAAGDEKGLSHQSSVEKSDR